MPIGRVLSVPIPVCSLVLLLAAVTLTAAHPQALRAQAAPDSTAPAADPAVTGQDPESVAAGGSVDPSADPEERASGLPGVAEVEAWLDGFLESYMQDKDVAGATVAIVADGGVLLSKGYGFANVEDKTPVDPHRTLFRVGSISKLFVWTAVMQLAERGLLELDADVNTYLQGVQIPATYDEPVTLEHILSHSAGFEDHVIGLFGTSVDDLRPLEELLSEQMPDRVRPPGVISSYSNHATAMAMLVVEQVSGVPWEQYISDNIFEPLGMQFATFAQPVPAELEEVLATGYAAAGGQFAAQDFEFVPLAPVGAASISAEDMARFMVAHLNLGLGQDGRILSESAALDMQSVLLRQAPGVNAMLHGFAEYTRNGEFAYGHGGDTRDFHTIMVIVPDREVGVFVSFNTDSGSPTGVYEAFMDRYFPASEPERLVPPSDFASRVDWYTGTYRAARYSHTDVTKIAVLVGGVEVTDSGDGAVQLSIRPGQRFIEIESGLFRDEDGHETIAFRRGDTGHATYLFFGDVPYIGFERVPTLESAGLHLSALGGAVVLMLGTLIAWPLTGFFRRRFGVEVPPVRIPGVGRLLLWLPCLLFVVFIVGLAGVLSDPFQLALGQTGSLRGLLWLPPVAGILALCASVYGLALWLARGGTWVGRLAYSVTALSLLCFLWQLNTFNLLGWRL